MYIALSCKKVRVKLRGRVCVYSSLSCKTIGVKLGAGVKLRGLVCIQL